MDTLFQDHSGISPDLAHFQAQSWLQLQPPFHVSLEHKLLETHFLYSFCFYPFSTLPPEPRNREMLLERIVVRTTNLDTSPLHWGSRIHKIPEQRRSGFLS